MDMNYVYVYVVMQHVQSCWSLCMAQKSSSGMTRSSVWSWWFGIRGFSKILVADLAEYSYCTLNSVKSFMPEGHQDQLGIGSVLHYRH
jgi:hypothetical protein